MGVLVFDEHLCCHPEFGDFVDVVLTNFLGRVIAQVPSSIKRDADIRPCAGIFCGFTRWCLCETNGFLNRLAAIHE